MTCEPEAGEDKNENETLATMLKSVGSAVPCLGQALQYNLKICINQQIYFQVMDHMKLLTCMTTLSLDGRLELQVRSQRALHLIDSPAPFPAPN